MQGDATTSAALDAELPTTRLIRPRTGLLPRPTHAPAKPPAREGTKDSPGHNGALALKPSASGTGRITPPWPVAFAVLSVLALLAPPWLALSLSVVGLAVAFVRLRSVRLFLVIVIAMVPYAVGSYFGALVDIRFYPWASVDQYWRANSVQLSAILLLAAVGFATPLAAAFDTAIHRSIESVRATRQMRPGATYVAWAITCVVAANDFRVLIANYDAIRTANRHNFDSEFIVAGGGFGILIALALTCILAFGVAITRRHVAINAAMLGLLWGPKLLAGNRLYTLMGISICALLFFLLGRSRRLKRAALMGLAIGAVGYFFLPTLWVDNPLIGLNEWIMPNTLYVSLESGAVTLASLGASPFSERWVMLIPPAIRPYEPVAYPELFSSHFSNVGVGANPFADVFTGNDVGTIIAFVAATAFILACGIWLSRISPLTIFVTFATMLVWGRSPFWETLAIIIDVALVTWPCFRFPPRRNAPVSHQHLSKVAT